MSATTTPGFAAFRPSDRNFFLTLVILCWTAVLVGFIPDIFDHFLGQHAPWAWVVHAHAAAYVGWLALLTTQVTLIRTGRVALHKRLGVGGLFLILAMAVLGPMAAFAMGHRHLGTPDSDPPFLILQLGTVLNFTVAALAALALRRDPASHKRLILIATILIAAPAGFGRWIAPSIDRAMPHSILSFYIENFLIGDLMLFSIAIYDWLTRRRMNRATAFAIPLAITSEIAICVIYYLPAWAPIAKRWIT
jgi:hypothetical protein